ncbi:MAG: hypothetical protein HY983_00635 [Candidatus Magasanikbacteria bacterium]|nr:hypothetical protein [Candidatus Magasanikbacteria bacterium]
MFRWLILFVVLAGAVLPAASALAADTTPPEFNPLCWQKKQCDSVRQQIAGKSGQPLTQADREALKEGFITGPEAIPCAGGKTGSDEEWGRCLPANVAKTEIAFGGKRSFLNIGDFIQSNYRYALSIVGILAAIMVVVAGFQWVTSGGNSEAITSAKKRIGGALIGLFIAYMSYFILNTINPALVNLRLPQNWLIRPQSIVPAFCAAAPTSTTRLAKAAEKDQQSVEVKPPAQIDYSLAYDPATTTGAFACGSRYFVEGGGNTTCFGDLCGPNSLCVNFNSSDSKNPYNCQQGILAGTISGSGQGLSTVVIDGPVELWAFCKSGERKRVDSVSAVNDRQPATYIFATDQTKLAQACGSPESALGFYLVAEVNDETGLTGKFIEGAPWSWGLDDWHAVGRLPKSGSCSINLAKVANRIADVFIPCNQEVSWLACSATFFSNSRPMNDVYPSLAKDSEFQTYLLSSSDLARGFQCDLSIDRSEFPALDLTRDPSGRYTSGGGAIIQSEEIQRAYNHAKSVY